MTQCPYNIRKEVFDVLRGPGRGLHKVTSVLFGQPGPLVVRNLTLRGLVAFIANEEKDRIPALDSVH